MLGINSAAVAGLIIESTATHAAPVGVGPKMKDLSEYSILQSISANDVKRDPFPHVVIDQCLPDHLYAELARTYPTDETILAIGGNGGSKRPRQNSRCDIGAHRVLSNPDIFSQSWLNFAAYHTSPQFLAQVVALLGADIRSIYPALDARLGRALESWTSEIRYAPGWRQSDIALDCHIGINTPTTRRSSVRRIHTDAPDELFAALFYFRRDEDSATGGDLEICRWRSDHDHFFVGSEIDEVDADLASTISYRPNTAVIFVNSDQSLHAVSCREISRTSRRLVNIMGRVSQSIPEGLFGKPQKPGIRSFVRQAVLRYKAATGRF